MAEIRLDKLLADSGAVTRSQARQAVRGGRVSVNGEPERRPERKCDPERDAVTLDGADVGYSRFTYVMLNKPEGVLSATEDRTQETVLDLLPPELRRRGLFPVGRLDRDTTGLLLLTNDGDFAHRVISPRNHVPKLYRAELDLPLDAEDVAAFSNGVILADGLRCLPAQLASPEPRIGLVTVYEGKYHQVKRMFASRGKHVLRLKRLSVGGLALDPELGEGEYRLLEPREAKLASSTK